MLKRLRSMALLGAVGLLFGLVAPAASAQDLVWERVGDRPINATDLDFAPDDALWAAAGPLVRLPPGGSAWEEPCDAPGTRCYPDFILSLTTDTLFISTRLSIKRSVDGGVTFDSVYADGGALYAASLAGPNGGLLLSGVRSHIAVAYSTDRGATWHAATFEVEEPQPFNRECYAFAAFPSGHAHAGRLLAGCLGGMAYSDGGALWRYSDLWQTFAQEASAVTVGPDGTAYAVAFEAGVPDIATYASADGAAWERRGPLPNLGPLVVVDDPGGGYALVAVTEAEVEGPGVYGSTDGGWTWSLLGRVATETPQARAQTALLGPGGRLYVATTRAGGEWVYRTAAPLVVANEPIEVPEATLPGTVLRAYPNPARDVLHLDGPAEAEAVVYDVLGRAVLRARLGKGVAGVDVSGLAPGVYVVRAGGQSVVVTVRW